MSSRIAATGRCAGRRSNWSVVDVYFGDDRVVPVESDESNEGMARRILLDEARAPGGALDGRAPAPTRYDALVRAAPPIDIVHLGLGPDGHTASLFPGIADARRARALRRRRPATTCTRIRG